MNVLAEGILALRGGVRSGSTVTDAKSALTDGELILAARDAADGVRRVALRGTPVVAVCLPLSTASIVNLLAAILGDYTVCYLDPAAPAERRDAILVALGPDVLIDGDGTRRVGYHSAGASMPAEPGYVAMSSGSTGGAPKAVLSSWSAIAAFVPSGADALDLDADACWAEVSHPAYDMAMTNLLLALASGARIHVSANLGDRLRPLRLIDRVAATHVRLAPRFVDLAAAERRPPGGLSLRVWGSGGDRLHIAHVDQIFAFGVPTVVNTYGTSETTGFASTARLASSDPVPNVQGSVPIGRGIVGSWETDLVEHGADLMLRIRSPHVPQGYLFGEPGEFPRWVGVETVLTGDVGVRLGDNLFCLGRAGRRVKRNGRFVDLDEIDSVLRTSHGVVSFTISTLSGELVSLVEGQERQLVSVRQELPSQLRPEILPDELRPVRQLPRLGNGKIDQAAAAALAEAVHGPEAAR